MKKIDMHVHVRERKGICRISNGTTYALPHELKRIYDRIGVEKAVILPKVTSQHAFSFQTNEQAYELVNKYSDMFYWFCDIDPRMGYNSPDTNLSHFLQYYKNMGAKGVGEVVANLYFDDLFMENLFHHCEKTKMPVLFHIATEKGGCYGVIDDLGLPRLEKELNKFPDLIFIGHSQPFWAEISRDVDSKNRNVYPQGRVIPGRVVELMRKYKNLYADLSANSGYNAITRDPEFGYEFMEEFQNRLFFATDICAVENENAEFLNLSSFLDNAVKEKKISDNAYKKICRNNALKILEDKS